MILTTPRLNDDFAVLPNSAGASFVACVETEAGIRVIKCVVRQKCEAKAMIDMTFDHEADAVYISLSHGKAASTQENGPFIYDVDAEGRVLGIEILAASEVLAPGEWQKARPPGQAKIDAAE